MESRYSVAQKQRTNKKVKSRDSSSKSKHVSIPRRKSKKKSKSKSPDTIGTRHSSCEKYREQIEKMLNILDNSKVKGRSNTPSSKINIKKEEHAKNPLPEGYVPCAKSRANKIRPIKPQKNQNEVIVNSMVNKPVIKKCDYNFNKYGNEDPYKIIAEAKKSRNVISKTMDNLSKSKMTGKTFIKLDDKKEESRDNGSMTTNKSSLFVGKTTSSGEDKEEEASSDGKLTVIEHDCENNYDLIFETLEGKYCQP